MNFYGEAGTVPAGGHGFHCGARGAPAGGESECELGYFMEVRYLGQSSESISSGTGRAPCLGARHGSVLLGMTYDDAGNLANEGAWR